MCALSRGAGLFDRLPPTRLAAKIGARGLIGAKGRARWRYCWSPGSSKLLLAGIGRNEFLMVVIDLLESSIATNLMRSYNSY